MAASPRPTSESIPILVMPMGYARRIAWVEPQLQRIRLHALDHQVGRADHVGAKEIPNDHAPRLPAACARVAADPCWSRSPPTSSTRRSIPTPTSRPRRSAPAPTRRPCARRAKRLVAAKRPVIYAGQGVHWAEAWPELKELAELLAVPVTTSLDGKSALPRDPSAVARLRRPRHPAGRCAHSSTSPTSSSASAARSPRPTSASRCPPAAKASSRRRSIPADINKDVAVSPRHRR